jgi:hypothetical protein
LRWPFYSSEIARGIERVYVAGKRSLSTPTGTARFEQRSCFSGVFVIRGADLDKSLLSLFVVVVGSLLLPAMRLARAFTPRRTRQATAGRGTISKVKEQIDHVPPAPLAGAGWFEFRSLTAEEKKEVENPVAAKGKPSTFKPRVYLPSPTTATSRSRTAQSPVTL